MNKLIAAISLSVAIIVSAAPLGSTFAGPGCWGVRDSKDVVQPGRSNRHRLALGCGESARFDCVGGNVNQLTVTVLDESGHILCVNNNVNTGFTIHGGFHGTQTAIVSNDGPSPVSCRITVNGRSVPASKSPYPG